MLWQQNMLNGDQTSTKWGQQANHHSSPNIGRLQEGPQSRNFLRFPCQNFVFNCKGTLVIYWGKLRVHLQKMWKLESFIEINGQIYVFTGGKPSKVSGQWVASGNNLLSVSRTWGLADCNSLSVSWTQTAFRSCGPSSLELNSWTISSFALITFNTSLVSQETSKKQVYTC